MPRPEILISIDVETDGPVPGLNSMIALGAAAFAQDGSEIGIWYATLHPLDEGSQDPATMEWWTGQPDAWTEVTSNRRKPQEAIPRFMRWCDQLRETCGARLIAAAWPAAFDFPYVNYYCHRFVGRNPLGFACLDIHSYASGLAGHPGYYGLRKQQILDMAGDIDETGLRPHVAVDDAIQQGRLLMALRRRVLEDDALETCDRRPCP